MWLMLAALTLAAAEIARRLGGDGAAGLVLLVVAASVGTTVGAGWGSKEAAETEKYRKALISGRKMPAANDPLDPDPQDVVALIGAAVSGPWPASESDRRACFSSLKLVDRDHLEPGHPLVRSGLLVAPSLGAAEGIWVTLADRLLSVTVFLYTDPRPGPSAAELGYVAVLEGLVALLGAPDEDNSRHDGEPTSRWTAGGTRIEMSCHYRRVDSLEIELKHGARAGEYEALLG